MATTSESSGRGPYRAPTYPQPQPHKAAGAGGSSGAATGPAGSQQQEASGHDMPAAMRGGGGAFGAGGGAAGQQPDSRTVSYANGSSGQQAVAPSPNLPSAPQSQVSSGASGIYCYPLAKGHVGDCWRLVVLVVLIPGTNTLVPMASQVPIESAYMPSRSAVSPPSQVHNQQPRLHGAQLQAPSGTANGSTGADGGPRAGPPGGGVFYHPGDQGAGHELLERILRQQRMAREGVRHQDGSGTNNPPPLALPGAAVAGDGSPNAVAAAAAAAAMAAALQQAGPQAAWAAAAAAAAAEGEGEEGAWAQQQGMAGGPAAFAFGQVRHARAARSSITARTCHGLRVVWLS